jgi:GrpB-like predicted nucleotidyltransferase (UPF0157 family)
MSKIAIIPYQPRWLEEFRVIGSRLRAVLGDAALRIDHIGSTSVPGLAAKDVIDVQITVADLEHPALKPVLEGLGLVWREGILVDHLPPRMTLEPSELEKRYAKSAPSDRPVHMHIRAEGRFNQRYALLCRDYLRTHPGTRDAYAQVKLELARLFPEDVDAYYAVKDPAFDLFMSGAWEWVQWTGWQPGSSDA